MSIGNSLYLLLIVFSTTFYVFIAYSMYSYVNDINKVNECKNILPFQKKLIWTVGLFRLVVMGIVLAIMLFLLFIKLIL